MAKLSDSQFEFLVNAALDTRDEAMFNDLMKRQKEESFFPEVVEQETTPFAVKEKQHFIRNLEMIVRAYKNNGSKMRDLEHLIFDVAAALDDTEIRLHEHYQATEIRELPAPKQDLIPNPSLKKDIIEIDTDFFAVSESVAQEAYDLYGMPGESLPDFVVRHFFSGTDGFKREEEQ